MGKVLDYGAVYDKLYQAGYHSDLEHSHAKGLCKWLRNNCQFNSILDIGCSHGWVLRYFSDRWAYGVDVSEKAVDICLNDELYAFQMSAHELDSLFPVGMVDVVISTDCFEHIHPDHVDDAVRNACHLARKYVAMKICPRVDRASWKKVVGHDLHLTVQSIDWWKEKFLSYGGELVYEQSDDTFVISYC